MIEIHMQSCAFLLPYCRPELKSIIINLMEILHIRENGLELFITDDQSQSELNLRFLGLHGPTNVLSFPEYESLEGHDFLGSISISAEAVHREAFLYGQPVHEHFLRVLVHGFLHLTGFEHGQKMSRITEEAVDVLALNFPAYT